MSKRKLETKDFKFSIEDMDEEKGSFSGYGSIFDVVDSYGDMIKPGAFRRKQFPLLWSHNLLEPIGVFSGKEDEKGLVVNGQLNIDVQRAREVRSLMKQGAVEGLSVGFQTLDEGRDKESGARLIKEIKLWEISPVVFPACPGAMIEEVRAVEPPELKPYANEHAARLKDPDVFVRIRELWRQESKGIRALGGPLKSDPDGGTVEQAIRFDKEKWTVAEAKKWLKDHDYKWIDFEPAKEPEKSTPAVGPETLHLIDATTAQIMSYLESKRR
jgi:HK97 family phage prohead protease